MGVFPFLTNYYLTFGSLATSPYPTTSTTTSSDCGQICDIFNNFLGNPCAAYQWTNDGAEKGTCKLYTADKPTDANVEEAYFCSASEY